MKTYDSLVDALNDLNKRGYTFELEKKFSALYCRELDLNLKPEKFNVDEYYRFEGDSNPDDSSILYAITSTHGVKGVLVDAYGVYAETVSFEMAHKLSTQHLGKHPQWFRGDDAVNSSDIKKILVPFDFSSVAKNALAFAIELSVRTGSSLHVLHVIELPVIHNDDLSGIQDFKTSYMTDLRKERDEKISAAIREYTGKQVQVTTQVSFGTVVHEIIDYAETREVDLIIVGSHGASGVREFILGSNAEKIVRKSTQTVLVVKEYHDQEIHNIVLAVESSSNPLVKLMEAIKSLQRIFNARLHLVHVNVGTGNSDEAAAQQKLQEIQDRFKLVDVTLNQVINESVEEGIKEFAMSVKADMISLSTHGRRGLSLLFKGSITQDLVNHSASMILTGPLVNVSQEGDVQAEESAALPVKRQWVQD